MPYTIDKSLRLNGTNEFLARTHSSTSSTIKGTVSTWIKMANVSGNTQAFCNFFDNSGGNDNDGFLEMLTFLWTTSLGTPWELTVQGWTTTYLETWRQFVDPSAWYHFVVAMDTAQNSNSSVRIYVNGVEETNFDTGDSGGQRSNPTNLQDQPFGATVGNGDTHYIGKRVDHTNAGYGFASGYIADYHWIAGTQYAASDFGEFDSDSGIWVPKAFAGTYGTGGVKLEFKQTGTGTNSSGIGADTSGQTNHFAVTNLTSANICTDTPTNNFPVFNSIAALPDARATMSKANLRATAKGDGSVSDNAISTLGALYGKWYAEFKLITHTTNAIVGICEETDTFFDLGQNLETEGYGYRADGNAYTNSSESASFGASYTTNDIIGVALDMGGGKVYFYKNGSLQGNLTLADTTQYHFFICGESDDSEATVWECNFGGAQPFTISSAVNDGNGYGIFEYTPPTNYLALCTKNIATNGGTSPAED